LTRRWLARTFALAVERAPAAPGGLSHEHGIAQPNSQGTFAGEKGNAVAGLPRYPRLAQGSSVAPETAGRVREVEMLSARNAEVAEIRVRAVEGQPTYGGELAVKPLIRGDAMTFLEIRYAAGVGAPLHAHTHESIAYVVRGKVKSTVGSEVFIMGPGDVCRHPQGVLHGLEAIEDSLVVEIKSPAPDLGAFFALRT
jgi:quercetin dioxygenase-like cupin family protein